MDHGVSYVVSHMLLPWKRGAFENPEILVMRRVVTGAQALPRCELPLRRAHPGITAGFSQACIP